jgi:hypothetical protein
VRGFGHIKVGRSGLDVDNEIDDLAVIYARAPSECLSGSCQLQYRSYCADADD